MMCRVFESCRKAELTSREDDVHIVGDIIVDLIICHGADGDIIIMGNSMPAVKGLDWTKAGS